MDKQLARRNMRMGIILFILLFLMLGITFLWAAIYNSTIS
jgi:hypothetical protein